MGAVLADATKHRRRQTLDKMTKGFGLDDAYGKTLDRIGAQRGSRVKLGLEVLMWISCSERPLRVEELCHALAVEVGADHNADNLPSIETLLTCTSGLVTIDDQASTARLIHFTLQEYLAAHPSLFITPHSMMAEICLTYLNFQSVCELSTALHTIPPTTPFLHYASCYWGFHARKEMGESVKRLALQHLRRDANYISANILLREEAVGFLARGDRYRRVSPDLKEFTGLHYITYMGVTGIAIDMVDMKIWDMNGRDSNGATPLIWAAKYGNSTLANLLLGQRDVDSTLSDHLGLTALTHAAKAGHQGVVKLLLERQGTSLNWPDNDGRTPLWYAGGFAHEGVAKLLLERRDVNPNLSDQYGQTPLSSAAEFGHEAVLKLLLGQRSVNPDLPNKDGRTPLSIVNHRRSLWTSHRLRPPR